MTTASPPDAVSDVLYPASIAARAPRPRSTVSVPDRSCTQQPFTHPAPYTSDVFGVSDGYPPGGLVVKHGRPPGCPFRLSPTPMALGLG